MAPNTYHHGDLEAAVLAQAIKSASAYGPQGISIREIARELEVSAPAIYRHYENQNALLLAVKMAILDQMGTYMESESAEVMHSASSETARTLEHLRAIGRGYIRFAVDEPGLFRTAFFPGNNSEKAGSEELLEIMGKPCLYLQSILEKLAQLKYIKSEDVEPYSFMLWSLTHGFALLVIDKQIIPRSKTELDELINTLIDTNLSGMKAGKRNP